MSFETQQVQYFNALVKDEPGEAYKLLTDVSGLGANLLAFTAVPSGPGQTRLTLFPEDPGRFTAECGRAGLKLDGPHRALLVQGDDEPGVLAAIHARLHQADIEFFAASGVASGEGRFGYVIYFREKDCARALSALQQ